MTTTITPPPQPPLPVQPEPPRRPSGAGRVVAILAIALGALIVIGTVFSAVVSTVASALVRTETRTAQVAGVSDLDVDLSAGILTVEFTDEVSEAQLQVTSSSGAGDWTFRRDGDTLEVASPDRTWFGPRWWWGGTDRAILRLPASLEGGSLDADIDVSAGEFATDGDFGDLELDLGAGRATVDGSARELSIDLSAGAADVDLADVRTAELSVSAGAVDARLTGAQPQTITMDVSAGSLDLRVPDGDYDVRSTVDAGRFDDRIGSTPGASSTITVQVSAGSATLRGE